MTIRTKLVTKDLGPMYMIGMKYGVLYKTAADSVVIRIGDDLVVDLSNIRQNGYWTGIAKNMVTVTPLEEGDYFTLIQE